MFLTSMSVGDDDICWRILSLAKSELQMLLSSYFHMKIYFISSEGRREGELWICVTILATLEMWKSLSYSFLGFYS